MKITTWNVNSLKVRLPHVLDWLAANPVNALGIQETKSQDEHFPIEAFETAGWQVAFHGQKTYNGVALVAQSPIEDVVKNIPGLDDPQARMIAGTVEGVRVINCYCPNGASLESDKYPYKLGWFEALHGFVQDELTRHDKLVVIGDFNIAPLPEDTWDPEEWEGKILCSPPERAALKKLIDLGLTDCWTQCVQRDGPREDKARFTWWDYRAAGFRRNLGLRIDHVLATKSLSETCSACAVDLEPRRLERPSDHAPVTAVFD